MSLLRRWPYDLTPRSIPWPLALGFAVLLLLPFLSGQPSVSAEPAVNALGGTWTTFAHGNTVLALARDGDTVWAGTYAGGAVAWRDEMYTQYLAPQTGLAGNDVRDIVVDHAGARWFATQRGLSRLDPTGNWTTYTVENTGGGLPSNNVTALAVDPVGRLWVGATQDRRLAGADECGERERCDGAVFYGGGIARFDGATWAVWRAPERAYEATAEQVVSANVTDLAVDPTNGAVWATFWPGWRWRSPNPDDPSAPQRGEWALDGAGGISAFDPVAGQWRHYQHDPIRDPVGAPAWPKINAVSVVAVEPNGRKWFGVRGRGLQTLLGETWAEFPAQGNPQLDDIILALAVDEQGRVWVSAASDGGGGRGVAILDHGGTPTDPRDDRWQGLEGLSGTAVRAILPDAGGVWLGYTDPHGNGQGIDYVSRDTVVSRFKTVGPPSNNIAAVAAPQRADRVWVGTGRRDGAAFGAGVGVRDGDGHWTVYGPDVRRGPLVGALTQPFAQGQAFILLNPATSCDAANLSQGVLVGDDMRPYAVDSTYQDQSLCWLGLTEGLRRSAPLGTPVYRAELSLAGTNVVDLDIDATGRVWAAVQGDVIDPATRHIRGGGLSVFESGRWTSYTRPRTDSVGGLPSNAVSAVLTRSADCLGYPSVWLGAGSAAFEVGAGVSVLDPALGAWSQPDPSGLSSRNISVLADSPLGCDVWAGIIQGRDDEGRTVRGGLAHWRADIERWSLTTTGNTPRLAAYQDAFYSVLADRLGRVWAGAATYRLDPRCAQCLPAWIGLQGHADATLNLYLDGGWTDPVRWEYQGVPAALAEDPFGRVWVGLSRGWPVDDLTAPDLAYPRSPVAGGVRVRAAKWLTVDPLNSGMADGNIQAIAVAADGAVWLGTVNHGLLRWQPDLPLPPTATPPPTRVPVATATPRATPTPTPRPVVSRLFLPLVERH